MAELGDIPLVIRPDGAEKYEIVADMRDIGMWERVSPRNTLRKLAENPSTEDYYSLAHIAIKRRRGMDSVPSFSEFKETHVVALQQDAAVSVGLDRSELIAVLEKANSYEEATMETVADSVLDLLEDLQKRAMTPFPGR